MLEIILIAMAWRKGWRWKALLPPLVAYFIIFIMAGAAEEAGDGLASIIIICALAEIATLIVMASRTPHNAKTPNRRQADVVPVPAKDGQAHH